MKFRKRRYILAGDIGGTHSRIAVFGIENNFRTSSKMPSVLKCLFQKVEFTSQLTSLEEWVARLARDYLGGLGDIAGVCLGVAGPIHDGVCPGTNLPWSISQKSLSQVLGLKNVELINDLVATAYGLASIKKNEFLQIINNKNNKRKGQKNGNKIVLSAGTGLGEVGLVWTGQEYLPVASEGGHTDFSPTDSLQDDLLNFLRSRWRHVSWERVLSGPGLVNIYDFFKQASKQNEPAWILERMKVSKDRAAVISQLAMEGKDRISVKAMDLFLTLYGCEAGNFALKFLATGGVILGGGISLKLAKLLQKHPGFINGFSSKGRLKHLLKQIPISVILNENVALLGAARKAHASLTCP